MPQTADGRLVSDDGRWWWDGRVWQPLTAAPAPQSAGMSWQPATAAPPPQSAGMTWHPVPGYAAGNIPLYDPRGKATASLILGIIGMVAWLLPIAGLPVNIVGLALGTRGRRSSARALATWGVVLSSIGLGLSIVNAVLGILMRTTHIFG